MSPMAETRGLSEPCAFDPQTSLRGPAGGMTTGDTPGSQRTPPYQRRQEPCLRRSRRLSLLNPSGWTHRGSVAPQPSALAGSTARGRIVPVRNDTLCYHGCAASRGLSPVATPFLPTATARGLLGDKVNRVNRAACRGRPRPWILRPTGPGRPTERGPAGDIAHTRSTRPCSANGGPTVMYPIAEARGFQEPCERVGPSNTPTDHEDALQRDASRHPCGLASLRCAPTVQPEVYDPIRHNSRPLRRCLAGSPRLSCPSSERLRTVNANVHTKRCSRQRSPASAIADRCLILPRIAGSLSALCHSPQRRGPSPKGRSHSSPRLKAGVSWEILDE